MVIDVNFDKRNGSVPHFYIDSCCYFYLIEFLMWKAVLEQALIINKCVEDLLCVRDWSSKYGGKIKLSPVPTEVTFLWGR